MIVVKMSLPLAACLALLCAGSAQAQQANMSFFITSVGQGKGADVGGLSGADKYCQQLAQGVGAGAKTWHAYLSTQGAGAVNARDRIGKGPWMNAKGVVVAKDVADLHGQNNLTKQTALTEKGDVNNGRGDTPNRHDILAWLATRRHGIRGRQGYDLQEVLDEQHAGQRYARPCRPHRLARGRCIPLVELVAPHARTRWRLLAGRSQKHRRRRLDVLLRRELGADFVMCGGRGLKALRPPFIFWKVSFARLNSLRRVVVLTPGSR